MNKSIVLEAAYVLVILAPKTFGPSFGISNAPESEAVRFRNAYCDRLL